ncbi:MAG: hypothetical protein GEU99_11565 [Luteitalea sp.]|nr:hypothetical protein [Luteitalea sp.]
MRKTLSLVIVGFVCSLGLLSAQESAQPAEDRIVGTWVGTWDGESTGKYTMSIEHDAEKGLGGTVETTPDSGEAGYTATFKSIVVDGEKVTMKYDMPDGAEVQIEGTLEGTALEGTWKAFNPGTTTLAASGTLTGAKS